MIVSQYINQRYKLHGACRQYLCQTQASWPALWSVHSIPFVQCSHFLASGGWVHHFRENDLAFSSYLYLPFLANSPLRSISITIHYHHMNHSIVITLLFKNKGGLFMQISYHCFTDNEL